MHGHCDHAARDTSQSLLFLPARPPAAAVQLNGEMLSANARIAIRHGWESKWYEWPLNLRGLLYYSKDVADGMTESVYLIGEWCGTDSVSG